MTDKEGRFRFAPLGRYIPPPGWERDESAFPVLLFFKPGYELKGLGLAAWQHGEYVHLTREERPAPARRIGWQREIRLYRYFTSPVSKYRADDPLYKRMTDEQKILGQLTNFASLLASNVDNSGNDFEPLGRAQRRKAVETQWRAIVMVDMEMRKHGRKYMWSTREIRDALAERSGERKSQ